jgi:hypothetical protein
MSYHPWEEQAACAGWINFGDWPARQQLEVCHGCPVTDPCAELGLQRTWSIEVALRGPVWGGMEPKQLAELVRQRGHQEKGMGVTVGADVTSRTATRTREGNTR